MGLTASTGRSQTVHLPTIELCSHRHDHDGIARRCNICERGLALYPSRRSEPQLVGSHQPDHSFAIYKWAHVQSHPKGTLRR